MFQPGETVSHQFIIPFVSVEIAKIIVSYKQNDHIVLERTVTSDQIGRGETKAESTFVVDFTETESLLFDDNSDCYAQLNVLLLKGTRCVSKEIKISTGTQHIREVISSV